MIVFVIIIIIIFNKIQAKFNNKKIVMLASPASPGHHFNGTEREKELVRRVMLKIFSLNFFMIVFKRKKLKNHLI